jgi:stage III sporulation protein AA
MVLKLPVQVLPPEIRGPILSMPPSALEKVEEIRVRRERPLEVITSDRSWFVSETGKLSAHTGEALRPDRETCIKMLNLVSRHSLYALEEELRRGYVTVEGGHRVGLAGRTVVEGGRVKHLRDIAGFNVRVARQVLGAGEVLVSHVFEGGKVRNTLIVSPPQCGKTTLIRDLARLASVGGPGRRPFKVGIVDERSEIAGCLAGVPQHDVGPRTDVLDACPKAEGMMMMIRSMSPEVLVVDEIGRKEDGEAVYEAVHAGVHLFATAHGRTVEEIRRRPGLGELLQDGVFARVVLLGRSPGPGTVEAVYDRSLRLIAGGKPSLKAGGRV